MITTSYDIKVLWHILAAQVSAAEDFFNSSPKLHDFFEEYKQNPKPQKQTQSFERSQFQEYFSTRGGFKSSIIRKSCQLLEDEFSEKLPKVENVGISLNGFKNLEANIVKILMPILGFIERNYLNSEFREKKNNFIAFDEFQTPVWAIFFVLLRAGKVKTLMKLINSYAGSLNIRDFAEMFPKYLEKESLNKGDRNAALGVILNNNEEIDVFQFSLFSIMTKYGEIFSIDLIAQLCDYIWFNVSFPLIINEELFVLFVAKTV